MGIVFILASQTNGFMELVKETLNEFSSNSNTGLALALGSKFLTAFSGFSGVWSYNSVSYSDLPPNIAESYSNESLSMFFLLVASALANAVAAILNGVVRVAYGAFTGDWITLNRLLLGIIGGILSFGIPSALWSFATTLTRNLGIHSLSYGIPILSLAFLGLAGQIGDVNAVYLIIRTAAIITANLIINIEAEVQLGFEALHPRPGNLRGHRLNAGSHIPVPRRPQLGLE